MEIGNIISFIIGVITGWLLGNFIKTGGIDH